MGLGVGTGAQRAAGRCDGAREMAGSRAAGKRGPCRNAKGGRGGILCGGPGHVDPQVGGGGLAQGLGGGEGFNAVRNSVRRQWMGPREGKGGLIKVS